MSETTTKTILNEGRITEQAKSIGKILEQKGVFASQTTLNSFVDRVNVFATTKFLHAYARGLGLTFHTRTCILQLDMKLANVSTDGSEITLYPEIFECRVIPSAGMRSSHPITVQMCEEISESIKLTMGFDEGWDI